MARRAENRKIYDTVPMDYFVQKCRAIGGAGLKLSLQSENSGDNGSVWFQVHHGLSLESYGEKITITLRPAGKPVGVGTDVHILSACSMPTQLIDYGKNQENCQAIFRYFEAELPQPQEAQPSGQYVQPGYQQPSDRYLQPDIQPQAPLPADSFGAPAGNAAPEVNIPPLQEYIFCTECGRKNLREAKFCMYCGQKMIHIN